MIITKNDILNLIIGDYIYLNFNHKRPISKFKVVGRMLMYNVRYENIRDGFNYVNTILDIDKTFFRGTQESMTKKGYKTEEEDVVQLRSEEGVLHTVALSYICREHCGSVRYENRRLVNKIVKQSN